MYWWPVIGSWWLAFGVYPPRAKATNDLAAKDPQPTTIDAPNAAMP
jgi:hypothetical protein